MRLSWGGAISELLPLFASLVALLPDCQLQSLPMLHCRVAYFLAPALPLPCHQVAGLSLDYAANIILLLAT